MRGKGDDVVYGLGRVRITPAYAGKRWCTSGRRSAAWDHPRVCGEKSEARSSELPTGGSPPRMRGKGVNVAVSDALVGITPAYAGKRNVAMRQKYAIWDHPRVCGEKGGQFIDWLTNLGSSPRMLGKVVHHAAEVGVAWITPAYAGKRRQNSCILSIDQDHPRACGEKLIIPCASSSVQGSPPRMRRKGRKGHGSRHQTRITPAYAGKSL